MKEKKQDMALSIYNIIVLINVFVACILMLNFMVAILSESYAAMQTLGSFSFICSQYTYCERYLLAFDDDSLCELVIHNPPMNMFTIFLVPVLPFSQAMPTASKYFSRFIFWFESMVNFLPQFLILNISLFPIIYVKTYYTLVATLDEFFEMLAAITFWVPMGLLFVPFLILIDIINLIQILAMHDGCKKD